MRRARDQGVILVNVLVVLALGAAMVTLMLASQDAGIDRARRAAAAAQAEALALGAEASVAVALRRDMVEAPESDGYAEPWARAAQAPVELGTGRFAVTVRDAQGAFDLNTLAGPGLAARDALGRLLAELDLPAATVDVLAAAVGARGPLRSLDEVEGLDAAVRARLAPLVAFLPAPAALNLNTADAAVMGALLRNRVAAGRLADLRDRRGAVTAEDLADLGLVPTAAVGFTSDVWDVAATAEVDGITVMLASRLMRRRAPGSAEVIVVARRFGVAPPEAPPAR